MIFVGIDPGLSGALAVLTADGRLLEVHDTPVTEVVRGKRTMRRMAAIQAAELVRKLGDDVFVTWENVHPMPGEGVVSAFSFGLGLGIWLGIIASRKLPSQPVAPRTWKQAFGLLGLEKDASRVVAARLWPEASLNRKMDHGRADALLIAEWGRRSRP